MKHSKNSQNIAAKTLRAFLATCLIVGLSPVVAQADTTVGVRVEAPAQVNETVEIGSAGDEGGEASDGAGGEADADASTPSVPDSDTPDAAAPKPINNEVALDPPAPANPSHIAADVPLGTDIATSETLLVDNLTYVLDHDTTSATLVGFYGNPTTKDVVVPAQVSDGTTTYTVTSIGQAADTAALSTPNTTQNRLGGGDF